MDLSTLLLRISLTFLLALIFGIERQRSHKPVGFGTFIFVAIGSCTLTVVAIDVFPENPIALLAAIVTGIGFLGAGALIKTTDKIFGFTTAASIWLFAILGVVIGLGHYEVGFLVYTFIWICIFIDYKLESGHLISYQKKLGVTIKGLKNEYILNDLFVKFKIKKFKLLSKKVDKKQKEISLHYLIETSGETVRKLIKVIEQSSKFTEAHLD